MKLILWKYQCKDCYSWFKSLELSGNYGAFLLRSLSNEFRFLDAISDSAFKEVSTFVKRHCNLDESKCGKLVKSIFTITCDPDFKGHMFYINLPPQCPHCHSRSIAHDCCPEPLEFIELAIPDVSHQKWNGLSEVDKEARLSEALEQELSK
ncbi:MAG: hypothetical protein KDA65_07175 [Planctomycetaceae bacterium]|nr:hypothetical protein [Planctomycetaceae bacterium]